MPKKGLSHISFWVPDLYIWMPLNLYMFVYDKQRSAIAGVRRETPTQDKSWIQLNSCCISCFTEERLLHRGEAGMIRMPHLWDSGMQSLPKIEAGLKQQRTSSPLLQAKHCATSKGVERPLLWCRGVETPASWRESTEKSAGTPDPTLSRRQKQFNTREVWWPWCNEDNSDGRHQIQIGSLLNWVKSPGSWGKRWHAYLYPGKNTVYLTLYCSVHNAQHLTQKNQKTHKKKKQRIIFKR